MRRPRLLLNVKTSILINAQVGSFSSHPFSASGVSSAGNVGSLHRRQTTARQQLRRKAGSLYSPDSRARLACEAARALTSSDKALALDGGRERQKTRLRHVWRLEWRKAQRMIVKRMRERLTSCFPSILMIPTAAYCWQMQDCKEICGVRGCCSGMEVAIGRPMDEDFTGNAVLLVYIIHLLAT